MQKTSSRRSERLLAALLLLVVAASIVLGGATRQGFSADIIVHGAGVVLMATALVMGAWQPGRSGDRAHGILTWVEVTLIVGLVGLAIVQASPALGLGTPAAAAIVGLERAGPVSVSPHATLAALASLSVPIGIFMVARRLSFQHRERVLTGAFLIGFVGLGLGFLQVAQGSDSELRFYEVTNPSEAVGFFANRNHFATLLCCLLIMVGTWAAIFSDQVSRGDGVVAPAILRFALYFCLIVTILTGIALARSRAGMLIAMVALAGLVIAYVLARDPEARHRGGRGTASRQDGQSSAVSGVVSGAVSGRWLVIALVVAVVLAIQFGLQRVMTRFDRDVLEDLRFIFSDTLIDAMPSLMPLGTGLGTFVPLYFAIEPTDGLFTAFANRAHNDWLEFAAEGGAAAMMLMAGFLVWYGVRLVQGARAERSIEETRLHWAGALIVLVILLHSAADYPLRTTAMSALFALGCALMVPAPEGPVRSPSRARPERGGKRRARAAADAPADAPKPKRPVRPFRPQSARSEQDWPDAWRRASDGGGSQSRDHDSRGPEADGSDSSSGDGGH